MPITQILLTATTAQGGGGGGGGGGGDTYPLPGSGSYTSNVGAAVGGVQGTALNPGGGVESVGNSQNGWAYYIKDGQFNNDTTFFNGVAKTGADTYGGFGDQAKAKEYYAIQWVGYIYVQTTGDYNIHLSADDVLYFWIGTNALSGNFNLSNYHHSVNNGQDYAGNSVTLTGGLYYPIRMWFQEWSGNEKAQVLIGPAASNALAMNQYTIVNNSQTEGHNPASPTYTITPVADNVDEGSSLEFTIGGTNITNGTYYWTVDGNGPFDGENGSFEIANNLGSITVTPTANQNTDGEKTFTLSIRSVDIYGTILATSESITINDTSLTPTPTYTLTPAANNVNEGSSLTITVGGTNITNGTYYWTIETGAGEFDPNTGEVSVTDNSGTFSVTPTADVTTEGSETFTVALRSGSVSGSILETSESITINDTSLAPVPPFSLEFNQPQQDFLRVDASSSFNLGNNWTIEFWISANNGSLSSPRIPGGQWGLINQGGWYGGMPDDNCILVGMIGGYLTINQSANDDIQFTEPTPNGVPSGAVTKISDNQGWDENNVGTNLPTTGGTGTGLTVNVSDGGSFYSNITINTPGSGYSNGDVITVTRPDVSETFSISVPNPVVWTHVAIVNNGGGSAQKVYYNGVEQAKVTGSYTSNGKTNTSDDIYIGRLAPNYNSHFDGKMALIRISNTAKYLTAFTHTTTYGVEADTVLFLDSDTPLIGQSYYELNGLTTVASNTSTIYFSKTTYPNLNNQVQAGNTLVDADTSASATVTAVYTPGGDPANWGVDYSPAFGGAVNIANFSGTRSAPVTNNGTTESESFPQALTGIVYPFNGGTYGVIYSVFGDPNLAAVSAVPAYARITSNIPGFGTRTVITRGSHPTGWLITYDATGLTGTTSQSDVFNFYWV
jgi:hypothetical protein